MNTLPVSALPVSVNGAPIAISTYIYIYRNVNNSNYNNNYTNKTHFIKNVTIIILLLLLWS